MTKPPSPKPMPTTGMPDRLGTNPPTDMDMKAGIKSSNEMKINPGRKSDDRD